MWNQLKNVGLKICMFTDVNYETDFIQFVTAANDYKN